MTTLLLAGWGTLVGLDLVTVGQFMIGRPLVAGTVAGAIAGDVGAGLAVGVILELFALDVLPVGAVRYPDYGVGAVAGVATVHGEAGVLSVGLGVAVGLAVAYLGELGIVAVRRQNSAAARRQQPALDHGSRGAVFALQVQGLGYDAARAVAVTSVGLLAASIVRNHPPVTVRGALLVGIVLIGAAVGTAVHGAAKLSGRGARLAWFAGGALASTLWVALR